jgi:ABC-type branched-subunit amino acid transport system ATPase component
MIALQVEDVSIRFGGIVALDGVSFEVRGARSSR